MAYYLSFITRGNTNCLVGNENYFQLSLIFQVCLQCSCGLILLWIWAIRWKTWRIQQIDPNSGHISTLISGPVTRRHTWPGTWHCGDGWYAADMLWRDGRVQYRRLPASTSGPIKTFADHGANSVTMCRTRLQVTRPVNLSWHFNQIYTKLLLVHWSELTAEIEIFCVAAKLEQSPG